MRTLITAANSAEAYKLKNKLNSGDVLIGDYLELPDLLIRAGKAIQLPSPAMSSYTHKMLALCLDNEIGTVYALRKEERLLLLNAKQLFHEYNIDIKATDDEI